jgi:hypothetical protein
MIQRNSVNERVKRRYLHHLKEAIHDPSILSGAQMRRRTNATWKEKVVRRKTRQPNPVGQSGPCRLRDLELHRS